MQEPSVAFRDLNVSHSFDYFVALQRGLWNRWQLEAAKFRKFNESILQRNPN